MVLSSGGPTNRRARRTSPVVRRAGGGDDRGVVLILVALSLVVICVVAAFAVDFGNARQTARQTQASVDAAALAGAKELPRAVGEAGNTSWYDNGRSTAMTYVVNNLFSDSPPTAPTCASGVATCTATVNGVTLTVTSPYPAANSSYKGIPSYNLIYVKACEPTPTFFARVTGQSSPTVCRDAVARRQNTSGGYDFGLVALDETQCGALTFAGTSETVLSSNGAVMVRSNCTSSTPAGALDASGSSWKLTSAFIGVVGSSTLNPCDPLAGNTSCTVTMPTEGIPYFDDPLGNLPALSNQTPTRNNSACSGTLLPGRYTSNCKIQNGNVSIQAGIYQFDAGFEMNGGDLVCVDASPTVTCANTGVLIWIKGGDLKLNGNGRVYLPPYKVAPYAGLSVWQTSTTESSINGTNDFSLGTVYMPNNHLKTNGNGGSAAVNITGMVVTKTISISGTFDFNILIPADAPPIPNPDDLGLVT
jgi:Flp pilus assembly protein TadG